MTKCEGGLRIYLLRGQMLNDLFQQIDLVVVLPVSFIETSVDRLAQPFARFQTELQQAVRFFIANLCRVELLVDTFETRSHLVLKRRNLLVDCDEPLAYIVERHSIREFSIVQPSLKCQAKVVHRSSLGCSRAKVDLY